MSDTESSVESWTYNNPEWLSKLLEDCKSEAIQARSIKLVGQKGRSAVWNMCTIFGFEKNGVPGQACRILERYLSCTFLVYSENLSNPLVRELHISKLKDKLPLVIACCVQLAAKMSSLGANVSARIVRIALLCKGINFSVEDIINTEAKIFSALGYCLPLWTSVDIGELLATELNLPSRIVETVALVIDVAEYYRDSIDKKVRWAANVLHTTDVTTVCTLHLAASSVAATATHLNYDGPDPVLRLSYLTHGPPSYLMCIRDAILAEITLIPLSLKPRLKRKQ